MEGHNRKVNLSLFFIQFPTDALGGEGKPFLINLSEKNYKVKKAYKYTSLETYKASEEDLDKELNC